MTLLEGLALLLTLVGVSFMALSSLGLLRMPDLYTRVHTAGKASTLGIIGVLLGVGVYYADLRIGLEMAALIVFFCLTGPVAAHMLDRAAYLTGVRRMQGTAPDEIEGQYDRGTRHLR